MWIIKVVTLALALASGAMARGPYGLYGVKIGPATCNVMDYGARGYPRNDTLAIQSAIDDCGEKGGGKVNIAGKDLFLISAIQISHSNVELSIASGTTLLISNDRASWPGQRDIITATDIHDVAITGEGTVDGQGAIWWQHRNDFRPKTVMFHGVTRAYISGVTFKNPPNHCLEIFADYSELNSVTVLAPPSTHHGANISHNTDAVDVHGTPFYVHDCYFDTGDDNVAVHASNVLVEDCVFGSGHGGSIGSLCQDYLSNITFRNITFQGTTNGARVKVVSDCPAGSLSNVVYENLTMEGVQNPIEVSVFYDAMSAVNFSISNITFRDIISHGSEIAGTFSCSDKSPCKNLRFENVKIQGFSEWTCASGGKGCDCFSYASGSSIGSAPTPCFS